MVNAVRVKMHYPAAYRNIIMGVNVLDACTILLADTLEILAA